MQQSASGLRLGTAAAIGYLIGTFPTASIVARRTTGGKVDLRQAGSGNPGSANALKVLGAQAGAAVLVGDVGKGAIACGIGGVLAGAPGAHAAGTAAVAGHCYPMWNGFDGGKGVAAGVGQCLVTFPAYFPIDAAVAVITASSSRWRQRAFAATVATSVCWVLGSLVWWRRDWPNLWGPSPSGALPLAAAASSAMILKRFFDAERRRKSNDPADQGNGADQAEPDTALSGAR